MRSFLIFVALLIPIVSQSQKAPIKYGKVDSFEVSLKNYQDADAVILCDYGTYNFDASSGPVFFYFTRHLRIKILSEEGLKHAQQTIPFYDLSKSIYYRYSNIYDLKAQTLNPRSNGKTQKTKVKFKSLLNIPADEDYNASVTINFPDVQVGSIIEYVVKIPTIEMVNPPEWYFQYDIPVLRSELVLTAPEDVQYSAKIYNFDMLDDFDQKNLVSSVGYTRGIVSYQAYRMRFTMYKVLPLTLDTEDPMYNASRMQLKLMLVYASRKFLFPGMELLIRAMEPDFKYKDKAEKNSTLSNPAFVLYKAPTLEKIPEELMKIPEFGLPLDLNIGINDTIRTLTKDCKTETDKLNVIYDFVSNGMNWNGRYRVFVDLGYSGFMTKILSRFSVEKLNPTLNKPYKNQTGTSSEINFILINLLRKVGLKADPVLVSTLDNGLVDTSFFNLHQFNHVVARVTADNRTYLLDAVLTKDGPIISTQIMNEFGMVVRKDEAFWISLSNNEE
ncbi:MAG: DUF3857 domain-containing protein [Bacteroidales bacterium]|nr:DUF3857 domain-containing protein [Bacteroidales bacterium]MBN2817402.1 DUF3857 domain-containing protein [Bacteroidales bacterium]